MERLHKAVDLIAAAEPGVWLRYIVRTLTEPGRENLQLAKVVSQTSAQADQALFSAL